MRRTRADQGPPTLRLAHITERIIGCFFRTYNTLDYGLLESVYRRALAFELRDAGLAVREEVPVDAMYRGRSVGQFRIDILVEDSVVLELKASAVLGPNDRRQLMTYLQASTLDVGLLLHFGPEARFHRVVSRRVLQ